MSENAQEILLALPSPSVTGTSLHDLVRALNKDIKTEGYAFVIQHTSKTRLSLATSNRAIIACDRHGEPRNYRGLTLEERQRPQRTSKRCNCRMKLKAIQDEETGLWGFEYGQNTHNHERTPQASAHVAHRKITSPIRREIERYSAVGTQPRSILAAIQDQDIQSPLVLRDVYNSVRQSRRQQLHQNNVGEALIQQLTDSDYFWHHTTDAEGHIEDLFLSSRRSIELFKQNNDVLILDCTYKTNAYKIPLLNMVAVTGQNTSIQLAVVFLQSENERSYTWAIALLRTLLEKNNIKPPLVFFTDQEVALVNALEIVFPQSATILCVWHVIKNVAAWAKRHGNQMADIEEYDVASTGRRINIRRLETPQFKAFMQTFIITIRALNEREFEINRQKLHELSQDVANYVEDQYFDIWRYKIAACYTKQYQTFGLQSTSRVESNHHTMKSWLKTSKADIYTFWRLMDKLWKQQYTQHNYEISRATMTVAVSLQTPFWAAVNKQIFNYALHKTLQQWEKRREGSGACSGHYKVTFGLPCKHVIYLLTQSHQILQLSHFHPHWWIYRSRASQEAAPQPVLPPRSIRDLRTERATVGRRSHQRGRGVSGNRRILSSHETTPAISQQRYETPPSAAPSAAPPIAPLTAPSTAPSIAPAALQTLFQLPSTQQNPYVAEAYKIAREKIIQRLQDIE
jgi:hypothetical protein